MAVVYRARDVQLGRNVALKLLSPVLALDDAFRQRFIRESRAAAAVDHPYIIPIFAAGESDGALFIAMRYVQGGDVRSLIDAEGPLPPDRAAGIIIQVALALDAAHLHGLVHRDIKPANMLLDSVAGSDQRDHVYLADFGLSKRSLSVTGLTSIGQFLGTPAYVAPEQVEGRPVDSRADQYALACASFEILSGAPPYERDDDLAVMWAHVSVPPPSLSERRPSLPAAADAVLAKAMAKAPADRYPTCIAFALALRQALGAQVKPGDLMVPEPGRPPTVVPGSAAGTPGERAGPRPHPATEISRPRARPEPGSAAAADQGRSGAPGRPAVPEPGAASQHAANPAEPSAPPSGAPPSRDTPAAGRGPELPPPPRPYQPPPASFRPREPSAAPEEAPPAQRSGPPPASPYEPPASFRPREPSAAPEEAPPAQRSGPPPASPYEPPASFRPREPSAAPDDAAPAQRSGPPPASPYEPPASFRPREPSAAPDEAPPAQRSGPPPASPYEPPTEDGWLSPLRSFGAEPAGAGASPRQQPSYQPPRREPARTGPPGRDDHGGAPPPDPERSRQARNRRWWRRGAVVIGCAAVVGIAAGVVLGLGGGTKKPPAGAAKSPAAVLPALSAPGCSTAVAGATALSGVHSADVSVGSGPFGVVTTPDGQFSFVTLANAVAVLSDGSSLAPTLDRVLPAPGATGGEQLTNDGKYLLVAANSGALVFSVADTEQGGSGLIGTLTSPFGSGAVEVAVSPDDNFAFVTLENSADLVVFNLQSALANGFGASAVVGKIPLHYAPVGLAISPDHRWLYATSRMRAQTTGPSEGTLTVIDLNRAETAPSSAVVSTATAGCGPARVVASPDGRYVWVTSRDSNMLLSFSATELRTDPAHALVARVNVGPAPIGLALVNGGSRILVANSNLSGQHGVSTSISVISTSAALSRRPAQLGQISTGLLPREFGLAPDGKIALVADSGSGQVQAIDLSTLP